MNLMQEMLGRANRDSAELIRAAHKLDTSMTEERRAELNERYFSKDYDDEIEWYEDTFGDEPDCAGVGNVDLVEVRHRIARNPKYTDRCRVYPLFKALFDDEGIASKKFEEDVVTVA